ncbi:MAG: DUF2914 domain-containing protein [Methylococcaceae bacterium]|nr:DUF2914 domain-containing protein [Methylococcaceae bacterium]
MKKDKKISIKVKSKTEQRIMEDSQLEFISEWNVKRIFIVLSLLLLFITIPWYYLNSSNQELVDKDITQSDRTTELNTPIKKEEKQVTNPLVIKVIEPLVDEIIKAEDVQLKKKVILPQKIKQEEPLRVEQSFNTKLLHPNISRARLAKGIKDNKEPYGHIALPFLVNSEQAKGFFYFTEINNMKGDTVFHEWLKDGKSIYKREIKIRGNNRRVSTSKLFNDKQIGQWQVRILNQKGQVLNEINFLVAMQ